MPSAPKQGTSVFYIEYILDAFGSMNDSLPNGTVKLDAAHKWLTEHLKAFPKETNIGLRACGHRVHFEQTAPSGETRTHPSDSSAEK